MQMIQRVIILLFLFLTCIWCRCIKQVPFKSHLVVNERNEIENKNIKTSQMEKNLNIEKKVPRSKTVDNMLEKVVLEIMTGNLTKSDIELLKSLNYSSKEIYDIRKQKNERKKNLEMYRKSKTLNLNRIHNLNETSFLLTKSSSVDSRLNDSKENEFEAYNRQAVYDYENMNAEFDVEEYEKEKSSLNEVIKTLHLSKRK